MARQDPLLIAMIGFIVLFLVSMEVWSVSRERNDSRLLFLIKAWFFSLMPGALLATLIYFIPACIVTGLIHWGLFKLEQTSPAIGLREVLNCMQVALFLCICDNLAEIAHHSRKDGSDIGRPSFKLLVYLPLAYLGALMLILMISIVLGFSAFSSFSGTFRHLFSLPVFSRNIELNSILLMLVIIIGGLWTDLLGVLRKTYRRGSRVTTDSI